MHTRSIVWKLSHLSTIFSPFIRFMPRSLITLCRVTMGWKTNWGSIPFLIFAFSWIISAILIFQSTGYKIKVNLLLQEKLMMAWQIKVRTFWEAQKIWKRFLYFSTKTKLGCLFLKIGIKQWLSYCLKREGFKKWLSVWAKIPFGPWTFKSYCTDDYNYRSFDPH